MVILYAQFGDKIHIVVLSVVNNIFAISMSFMTYKVFVFKTRGNWLTEWMRSFVVYGGSATLSIALLWLLVDVMFINIYLAQALTILLVVIASYIGHSRFTFKQQGVSDD